MSKKQSSVVAHINLAREHAKLENFDASLKSYENAKDEIQYQIDICEERSESSTLNILLKDTLTEEASVRRIKDILDQILDKLDKQPSHPFLFTERLEPEHEDPSQQSSNVQRTSKNIYKTSQPTNSKARIKRFTVGNQQRQIVKPSKKQNARPPLPQTLDACPDPDEKSKITKNEQNDPLLEQILDMGILVRDPNVQWDSIAGLSQVKRLLRQNLVILPMRPDICHGLLAPWRSVLFYGPPGTGKTFLAKAVATECHRTFFNVTSATITSKFLGESEKLVSHLFSLALKMAPSTIFFDELDAIASQRGGDSEMEASRRIKAQLLTALEGIDSVNDESRIFVLAATNFPWDLDEALLRRFQKRVYIPLPDAEARLQMMKMCLGQLVDTSFDFIGWAKRLDGYSCSDISNLCRDTAHLVFIRQTEKIDPDAWVNMSAEEAKVIISNEDFAQAVQKRKSSVSPEMLEKYEKWKQTKGAE